MDSAACSVNIPRVLKTRAPVEADLAPADRELLAGRKVVVVMPAYNAARTQEMTWRQIPKARVDQVVLVDDFSRDSTVEVARTLKLNVIAHPHNVGYGGNQKTCNMEALRQRADVVVMLHPDGQYDPTLVPDIVRPMLRGDYDVVLGSRFLNPGGAGCRSTSTSPTAS
jgi:glycosyltransferase involved in cell wall biosynthesis